MTTTLEWKEAATLWPDEADDGATYLVALECGIVVAADRFDGEWYHMGETKNVRDRVLYFAEWPNHPNPCCGEVQP
jgi:hypothetical protein